MLTTLRDDGTRLYEYDYRNQLCRVTDKTTSTVLATFDYDVLGRRTGKACNAGIFSYLWARNALAVAMDATGLLMRFHSGAERQQLVAAYSRDFADLNGNSSVSDFVWLTPMFDGASNCAGVTFGGVGVVESYSYSFDGTMSIMGPSGQSVTSSGIGWTIGYRGYQVDPESLLCYSRFRYYSPAIGRWITGDPIGTWGDWANNGNGYAFVGNDYGTGIDPFGLAGEEASDHVYAVGNDLVKGGYTDASAANLRRQGIPFVRTTGEDSAAHLLSTYRYIVSGQAGGKIACCVRRLVLILHGNDAYGGQMSFDPANAEAEFSSGDFDARVLVKGAIDMLTMQNTFRARFLAALSGLKSKLCKDGKILLLACNVMGGGNDRDPTSTANRMARVMGVPVGGFGRDVAPGDGENGLGYVEVSKDKKPK